MKRRSVLAGAGAIPAGIVASLPRPAIAQGIRQLERVERRVVQGDELDAKRLQLEHLLLALRLARILVGHRWA